MRTRLLALVFAVLTAPAAWAGDVRLPQTGFPAYTLTIPDDWTTQPGDGSGQVALSANRSAVVTMDFSVYPGTMDDFAAAAMKVIGGVPPVRGGDVTVSGYKGAAYQSSTTTQSGVHGIIRMTVLRIDSLHYALYLDRGGQCQRCRRGGGGGESDFQHRDRIQGALVEI
jgi:hypothetical protein